ncbi:DUF6998 domain-containing protein [Gluconacetobacter takamatsuzukensis]|uniref:DUF6998 domain-containing protein n=1 Tax=Gluconacetobacter takamatsuzukensis TaxID=1286190 RepID=A0A7W4KEN5_9PROT|nr:hypothetical protein [Gluconacetobacter takamatsuzukensis]MBB2205543.1 hypothetical protein [Gluconacetobacter takamatsuzukensis]
MLGQLSPAPDLSELPTLLASLYQIVDRLEQIVPRRKFTPDGHLVGSIGEAIAEYCYGLELLPPSSKQHDARAPDGRFVQIKLTQGSAVALSHTCDHLIVIRLDRHKGFSEVFNGPGAAVWATIEDKAEAGRQRSIRISRLQALARDAGLALPLKQPFPAFSDRGRVGGHLREGDPA